MSAFDLFSLQGKVALITGATSGIGVSMAEALAQFKARQVIFVYRPSKDPTEFIANLEKLAEAEGSQLTVTPICVDLKSVQLHEIDAKIIQPALDASVTGQIDILINNAGTAYRHSFEDFPEDQYHEVLHVNLHVPTKLSQLVGKHMLEKNIRGKIIITCSLNSFNGGFSTVSYTVSKGGVRSLVKALSNEWAGKGITVNGIAPGYIKTNMTADLTEKEDTAKQLLARIPIGRFGKPEDFKGTTVFLSSAASDYLTGEIIFVDGGWMAW